MVFCSKFFSRMILSCLSDDLWWHFLFGTWASLLGGVGQLVFPAAIEAFLQPAIIPQSPDGCRVLLIKVVHLGHLHLQQRVGTHLPHSRDVQMTCLWQRAFPFLPHGVCHGRGCAGSPWLGWWSAWTCRCSGRPAWRSCACPPRCILLRGWSSSVWWRCSYRSRPCLVHSFGPVTYFFVIFVVVVMFLFFLWLWWVILVLNFWQRFLIYVVVRIMCFGHGWGHDFGHFWLISWFFFF